MEKVTIELDYECRDRLVIASLRESAGFLRADKKGPKSDKKLIKAMELVAQWYGGSID
jgi:hypothetical protein